MKKLLFIALLSIAGTATINAQATYKVVTVVESIIPAGTGRSRIIESTSDANAEAATTERVDGKKSDQGDVKRGELKVDEFKETKLLNFFSATGINFQNVASNDAIIAAKLNEMAAVGWELAFVTTGVESEAGTTDGEGIFVTRYIFKR